MKRLRRIYLAQTNNRYGPNVYLPYSVGLLWAYAQTFPEVTSSYEMCGFQYLKEPIDVAVSKLDSPDLVGISCYIWNWEWSKAYAQEIKRCWPECVILAGGVHIYDESPRTLEENPFIDFAIYGEGEGAFVDFLIEHAKEDADYSKCGSLIWRDILTSVWKSSDVKVNKRRPFVPLEQLRSPYLDGVFDSILPLEPRWQPLQETDRGCPYSCSFCAWGASAIAKLRPFPMERVLGEIDWFGQHGMDYLDNADANFGIRKQRNLEIVDHLVATKKKYSNPKTFRTSFAKNSNDFIWEAANKLHQAGMLKAVTLAMQSMNQDVLTVIHRKNIKFDMFADLIKKYEDAGIPTYTELIMGLPGESLSSYIDGIERNLQAGQHSGLFMYMNIMLPNTEQNNPEYIERHGLETVNMQAMLTHGTPDASVIPERQETIVATRTMPHADWKRAYLHSKLVEVFHCQGLLQQLAIFMYEEYSVRYRDFYRVLSQWIMDYQNTIAAKEMTHISSVLERALRGGSWDCVDNRLGDISWPPEEFAFGRICLQLDTFYKEMESFWEEFAGLRCYEPNSKHWQVWDQQVAMLPRPEPGREQEFAREIIWYSRKGYRTKKAKQEITTCPLL